MMCPHELKVRLIMTTLNRYANTNHNPELLIIHLRMYKRERRLGYKELSDLLAVPYITLYNWLVGRNYPNYIYQTKIKKFLAAKNFS